MSQSEILRVQIDPDRSPSKSDLPIHSAASHKHSKGNKFGKPSATSRKWMRFCVFLFCLIFIVLGRATVPDNPVPGIVDKLMDSAAWINRYVLARQNLRDGMLIACSFFMDVMFFSLGAYWIFYGNSSRLIVSTLIFYFVRAAVQQMFLCPYPDNYSWDDPGFPSIVVPYGRSSDFFFSGHIGFVTICMSEWLKYKKYLMAFLLSLGGIYTAFILLVYRAHYSIDIFTGIIFGSWTHMMIDKVKDDIDEFFDMIVEVCGGIIAIITGSGNKKRGEQELLDKPANTEE